MAVLDELSQCAIRCTSQAAPQPEPTVDNEAVNPVAQLVRAWCGYLCASPRDSREWALKRELGSTHCVAASQAVGEVLAQRCRQAGIIRMVYRHPLAVPLSFRTAMKEGGVTLSEPRQ
uniref:Mitochondrial ribosomal protein L18 n=1 Tax=Salmo trutta TaxID=8032 RepID=A0A674DIR1_SALTR